MAAERVGFEGQIPGPRGQPVPLPPAALKPWCGLYAFESLCLTSLSQAARRRAACQGAKC